MHDSASKQRLRLLIRLFATTHRTEAHLREFLRTKHNTTLPRFDVMAALFRKPTPVSMSELSRMLLVSNGNVTTVVDRLKTDGLVKQVVSQEDRRVSHVSLTPRGRKEFETMAADHEIEVSKLFAKLADDEVRAVTNILKRFQEAGETA